jgi:hypothetical protein
LSVNEQLAAACDTVNVCDAMSSVPVRADAVGFAATEKATEPPPVPLDPLVIVIQASLLAASQEHPAPAVTVAVPVPPVATTDWLVGVIEYVHDAPFCVTVNVCPATVTVPVRWLVLALAAALKLTVPLPLPDAPAVTVNQLVLLLTAVHPQPACVVTFVDPAPPPATTDWPVGEIE